MAFDLNYYLSEECKRHIFFSALKVYSRPGTCIPSLNDLAREADVPPGVIKRHFSSLANLKNAVLEWFFEKKFPKIYMDAFEKRILTKQTLSEVDILLIFFETCETIVSRYSSIFYEDIMQIAETKDKKQKATYFSKLLFRFSEPLHDIIRKGQEKGFFLKSLDSEKAVRFFGHFLQGAVMECFLIDDSLDPGYFFDRLKKHTQDILCGGKHDWHILSE